MTREEVSREYENDGNIVTQPGKFEREPLYTVYFYDAMMNGDGEVIEDEVSGSVITEFMIDSADILEFPELDGHEKFSLYETDQGFVIGELI